MMIIIILLFSCSCFVAFCFLGPLKISFVFFVKKYSNNNNNNTVLFRLDILLFLILLLFVFDLYIIQITNGQTLNR